MKNFFLYIQDIYKIICSFDKINFIKNIFFSFISSVLDLFSVALFFPLLVYLVSSSKQISLFGNKINFSSDPKTLLTIFTFFLLLFLFKYFLMVKIQQRIYSFNYDFGLWLSDLTMAEFLDRKFIEQKKIDHANELHFMHDSVLNFISLQLVSFSNIIIDIINIIIFVSLLLYVNFAGTILVITIGGVYLVFAKKRIFPKIRLYGNRAFNMAKQRISEVNNTLNGYREIRLFEAEKFVKDKYKITNKQLFENYRGVNLYSNISRSSIEFALVIILLSLFLVNYINSNDLNTTLVSLSIFLGSLFRLMPSIYRAATSLQNLVYDKTGFDAIKYFLSKKEVKRIILNENTINKRTDNPDKIILENVGFSYTNYDSNLFEGVNLVFNPGKYLILGESGSGKTTFMDLIVGLIKPTTGKAYFETNGRINFDLGKIKVAYASQNNLLTNTSIIDNIKFGDETVTDLAINKYLNSFNLSSLVNSFSNNTIGENGCLLSGGQKQRVSLIRTLVKESQFLILDESTSALDYENSKLFYDLIFKIEKKYNYIFSISHDLTFIDYYEKVIFFSGKKIHYYETITDFKKSKFYNK